MSKFLMMLSMSSVLFPMRLNAEPEATGGAPGEPAPAPTPTPGPVATPAPTPALSGLDFLPETFRNDPSFTRYKNAEELAKGFKNLEKFVGQKEVVQGLVVPGEGASEEDISKFYQTLGRPESADKYALPSDVQVPEGYNLDEVKNNFTALAHKNNLTQKQAEGLYKDFIANEKESFTKSQEEAKKSFDKIVVDTFGTDYKANLDLAKRGAKAIPGGDKINLEDITHPFMLQALAKLGEVTGEDVILEPGGNSTGAETLREEAVKLQRSQLYQSGDPATLRKVEEIYKTLYPKK